MQDKVLLITGAASESGMATARAAAREGYQLVLAAHSQDALDAISQELGPENVVAVGIDTTSVQDQDSMVEQALEYFGRIDAVFICPVNESCADGLGTSGAETWRSMLMNHVYSIGLTIQATLPALRKTRGHILLAGFSSGPSLVPGSMLNITRWAIVGMGHSLRHELEGSGIHVTMIGPDTSNGGELSESTCSGMPGEPMQEMDIATAVSAILAETAANENQ
ncbi:SDR family oxidoreductase [Halomonas huangheensis]|uniref:Short-chain dehydrogenase n=1 Tax=Halomonas huangheensis TaxID=1178482 RepID=W1N7W5_9GAMM|nr:SDR family NAD(P)-dependent oxidoreductase [Halomonas huangheensis]ALM53266.1 hypothetical protein AR456_13980 [Halomonas huangheensis]ERL51599.1 hypothetical protein BJB45_13160 [Halomonas huangheensis]